LLLSISPDRLLPLSTGSMHTDLSVVATSMPWGTNTASSRRSILMAQVNPTKPTLCQWRRSKLSSRLLKDRQSERLPR